MDVYTLGLALSAGEHAAARAKDRDAIAVRDALTQLKNNGNAPTVSDTKVALLALRTLDLGSGVKAHATKSCTVTMTATELVIDSLERDAPEEPTIMSDAKLLAPFFPPGSKATLTRRGMIQCSKTCTLVFVP